MISKKNSNVTFKYYCFFIYVIDIKFFSDLDDYYDDDYRDNLILYIDSSGVHIRNNSGNFEKTDLLFTTTPVFSDSYPVSHRKIALKYDGTEGSLVVNLIEQSFELFNINATLPAL